MSNPQGAKLFDDARGSAVDCAGLLDALVAQTLADQKRILDGKSKLPRVTSMLTKPVERLDQRQGKLRDDGAPYGVSTQADGVSSQHERNENEGRGGKP